MMRYFKINQPLKPFEPQGWQTFITPLNIAESKLRVMIPDLKIEITDLDNLFNDGIEFVIVRGKTVGWVPRPVF